tara:strand:+ start:282 stop:407 length:126 start_codon:yes stop_codon:yes gene_type:complete
MFNDQQQQKTREVELHCRRGQERRGQERRAQDAQIIALVTL